MPMFHEAVSWHCNRDTGLTLLKAVSEDEEVLKTLLSSDFEQATQCLKDPEPEPEPAPVPSRPRPRKERPAKAIMPDSDEDRVVEKVEPRQTRSQANKAKLPPVVQDVEDNDAPKQPKQDQGGSSKAQPSGRV